MATASDLIEETRSHLIAMGRDEVNRLNGSHNNLTTSVTFEFPAGGIAPGAVVAVDLELMYVWSVAGQVATVQRGYLGSTAASHSDDAFIYVNPRWSSFAILRAINAELDSYTSPKWGLYQMKTVDLTYASGRVGYDLTSVTDLIDVYELRWKGYTTGEWPLVRSWSVARDMPTGDFASGLSLQLDDGAGPGRTIRVRYKAKFTHLAGLSDNVTTVSGLADTALDIPPLGAAARLVAPREVKRAATESQPESRTAAEVPPGANRQAAGTLLQIRDARLREEAARLYQRYPQLRKVS